MNANDISEALYNYSRAPYQINVFFSGYDATAKILSPNIKDNNLLDSHDTYATHFKSVTT